MEKKIFFESGEYRLEGLLDRKIGYRGLVVTHPHPLYGGDMYNIVVESVARAYQKNGLTTLRFNFRGVGQSQGGYDEGIGEQADVQAAIAYLQESGISHVDLAGYSFGSWVNVRTNLEGTAVQRTLMVSPPVAFIDFAPILPIPSLALVVSGTQDDFAPPAQIKTLLPQWNPRAHFEVIEGADHFYGGYLDQLESAVSKSLQ